MPAEVQSALESVNGLQVVIWAAAIIGVGVGVYKAWPVLSRFVTTINALADLPEFMARARDQLENDHDTNLRHELTEVLDTVTAMDSKLAGLHDTVAAQGGWQKKHELKSDAAFARIDRLEKEKR